MRSRRSRARSEGQISTFGMVRGSPGKIPMGRSKGKPAGQRQLRVGEELRHALVRILVEEPPRDPALHDTQITITEVRVSPDLGNATAFVMPLGGQGVAAIVAALGRAAPYLRGRLARALDLRHTPRLAFQADHSFDEAARVSSLLASPTVSRDLSAAQEDEAEGQDRIEERGDHGS